MVYILFILGFFALVKGADLMVDGASSIAKRFGISTLVIGLTVVAFGTSAPELVVSVLASVSGHNELAIGNIIGSNISNVFLMLGICAMIAPLNVKKQTILNEIPFAILAVVILLVFVMDTVLNGASINMISRSEGIALLSLFVIFMYYTFWVSKKKDDELDDVTQMKLSKSIIFFVLGLIGLTVGGRWIVNGAIEVAQMVGMSEAMIGLTIVAIGTSLPELAASAVATYKGKTSLAIGNVVGSNIFNVLLVLGINAVIGNVPYEISMNRDLYVAIFSIFLLFIFVVLDKRNRLRRWEGIVFIGCYFLYILDLVIRS